MLCPSCGCDTSVLETRKHPRGVRRLRRCQSTACLARLTTIEVVVPAHRKYSDALVVVVDMLRVRQLRDAVQALDGLLGKDAG